MTVKSIDTGDILDIVDKAHLFAGKVELLFHSMDRRADDNNDTLACIAFDVIQHFQEEINDKWEKIRTADDAEEDYGSKFLTYVVEEKGLTQDKLTDKQASIFNYRFLIPLASGHIFTESEIDELKKEMGI